MSNSYRSVSRKRAKALVCIQQGRYLDAKALYGEILRSDGDDADTWGTLGAINGQLGDFEEAINCFRRSLAIKPGQVKVLFNLAQAFLYKKRLQDAVVVYREVIRLLPNCVDAHRNLGVALQSQQKLDEAITCYRRVLQLQPDHAAVHSNRLFALNYHPDYDAKMIFNEHRRWGELHADNLTRCQAHDCVANVDRQLRVGYISPDLRQHSVACFFEPLLLHRNANAIHVTCYADVAVDDDTSLRLKRLSDQWHKITGLSDLQVVELIRSDQIDILVDLAGHTANNRLLVFARRPAPVQITYLGYPTTTGLKTMDYRLTDARVDPLGKTEELYTETLLRLPDGFLCYQPPAETPPVSLTAENQSGHITFGSFNNLTKITPQVVSLWARILQLLPDARLHIKNNSLADPATCKHYHDLFLSEGISRDRIDLIASVASLYEHLVLYSRVDIALDTFPYNGTTTTCEAMWMGVPVITLAGNTSAGRVGSSLLHQLGLSELIGDQPDDYCNLAVALAYDSERRIRLRQQLRPMMETSSLCDGQSFARTVETVYRAVWRDYCLQL